MGCEPSKYIGPYMELMEQQHNDTADKQNDQRKNQQTSSAKAAGEASEEKSKEEQIGKHDHIHDQLFKNA